MAADVNPNPYRLFIFLGLADIVIGLGILAFGFTEDLGGLLIAGVLLTTLGIAMSAWASLQSRTSQRR
ncbi:hypothetical protein ACLM5J_11060 [Nocardioides sp. Bht2]|uniref:hypothetical protein n=1 Tax=Nocardioides sp. Bht2 TaxID=3392297 RepID=UPI0039B507CE